MKDLKEELRESFINPLQFKFFVQKLEEEESETPLSSKGEGLGVRDLYKELYKTYENFKV